MNDNLQKDAYILTVKLKTNQKENSKKIVIYASDFYCAGKEAGTILVNLQNDGGYKVCSLELCKV